MVVAVVGGIDSIVAWVGETGSKPVGAVVGGPSMVRVPL